VLVYEAWDILTAGYPTLRTQVDIPQLGLKGLMAHQQLKGRCRQFTFRYYLLTVTAYI